MKIFQQTIKSQLIDQFKSKILDEEWEQGERIPTENDLSQIYSVGRSSIREALQHLIGIGLLERNKRGISVSQNISEIISEPLSLLIGMQKISPNELFEVRLVLEVSMAGLAALRKDPDDIESINQIVVDMEASETQELYVENNIQFHRAVARAARNQLLFKLFEGIKEPLRKQQQEVVHRQIARREALHEHREILQAIIDGDNKLAEVKMSIHLKRGMKTFLS